MAQIQSPFCVCDQEVSSLKLKQPLTVDTCVNPQLVWITLSFFKCTFWLMCCAESDDFTFMPFTHQTTWWWELWELKISDNWSLCWPLVLPSAASELSTSNWTTFCPSRWGDGAAVGHLWMLASWNTSEVNPLWNRFIRSSHSARTVMMSSLFAVYPSDLNGLLKLWLTELKCIGERNHVLYQKNLTVNINWQDSRQSTDEILIWKTRKGRYSTQVKYLH